MIIRLLLAMSLAVSCSVKEDRTACPCLLRLEFGGMPQADQGKRLLLSVNRGGECIIRDTLSPAREGGFYELEVPKDELYVNLWSEEAMEYVDDGKLKIPLGDECPAVRMFSSAIDTRYCEFRQIDVDLSKNYCLLTVSFVGDSGGLGKYLAGVDGRVDGYSPDGSPSEGEFFHFIQKQGNGSGNFTLMLPRQRDASLKLDIFGDDGLLKSFSLGNYLLESGYDWTAKDLRDATVLVDFAGTQIRIEVGGWDHSYDFDIVF